MREGSEVYVGLDTSKLKISVALAEAGRDGEVRFLGEIDSTPEAVERLVRKLAKRHGRLFFAYEAGPTGYGLHRLLTVSGVWSPPCGSTDEVEDVQASDGHLAGWLTTARMKGKRSPGFVGAP